MKVYILNKKHIFIVLSILLLIILFTFYSQKFNTIATNSGVISTLQERLDSLFTSMNKVVYLTFDDGPTPNVTPKILDILKEEKVTATFFVVGASVKDYPDIVKRAYDEGHYIANHGYSHKENLLYKNTKTFMSEISLTDNEIAKALEIPEYNSYIFRFPCGYSTPSNYDKQKQSYADVLNSMGYAYIDWNSLNKDSENIYTRQQLYNNFISSIKKDGTLIVLMHDTKYVSDSSTVLKDIITYLKNEGYVFKNFYDLIY